MALNIYPFSANEPLPASSLNAVLALAFVQISNRLQTASLGSGVETFLTTPTSANLAAALTDETGGTKVVFSDSPTLTGTVTLPGTSQIDSTGLGLGGAATTKLHIFGSNATAYAANSLTDTSRASIQNTNTTNGNFSRLAFVTTDDAAAAISGAGITGIFTNHAAGSVSADVVVQLRNAGTIAERSRWYSAGDFRVGTGSALATTATDGFLLMPTSAGAPTGVPTNAGAGQIPSEWDKTNNIPYWYNSGWIGGVTETAAGTITFGKTLGNGAAAAAGTLGNAPVAGNPTKWIPFNDNGTTRYVPAW